MSYYALKKKKACILGKKASWIDCSASRLAVRGNQELTQVVTTAGREWNAWGLGPLEPWEASQNGEGGSGVAQQKTLLFPSRVREFFLPENVPTTAADDKIYRGSSSKQPLSGSRTIYSVFVDMKVNFQ